MKKPRTMKNLGEFGLIRRLRGKNRSFSGVETGIGDDAAVLSECKKKMLFTTDMIIENKHFRLREATPFQIGWKALAVNISDIAAMGGVPKYAVVSAGIPAKLTVHFLDELYRGLNAAAKRFHVSIVGGDTNASDKLVLSVALLGEANLGKVALRSGARPGDRIFVTGALGGSIKSKKHLTFIPKVKESQFLLRRFRVSSMMDISDGLASDLHKICEESRVGALLFEEKIPRSKNAGLKEALTEGEDFELLFTLSGRNAKKMRRFTEIGVIMPEPFGVLLVSEKGRVRKLTAGGFDHFK